MKRISIFLLLVFAIAIGIYFLVDDKNQPPKDSEPIQTRSNNIRVLQNDNNDEKTGVILSRILDQATHKAILINDFDVNEYPFIKPSEGYSRYMTPSSSIEIRNPDGQVLYKAEQDNPFVGLKSIVGGIFVAINRGDGRYRLINTNTLEFNDIPSTPPTARPIGFNWNWLDQNTLVGVAGVGYPDSVKQVGRCCDQHVVAASLLYLYDTNTHSLQAVSLPSSVRGLVFNVSGIAEGGHVELVSASGHEDDGSSLGWYHILPK